MDIFTAATAFDDEQVYDAYTSAELFKGQPDLYDSSERDSELGFRRTISTKTPVLPTRGVVKMAGDNFIVGRTIKDYLKGEVIRQHVLLHPADGLVAVGPSDYFLNTGDPEPTEFYGAMAWVKDRREEHTTSQSYPVYHVYFSTTESMEAGWIVRDHDSVYHRVEAISFRTGGLQTALVYELGASAVRTVAYTDPGSVYDPATDSSSPLAPIFTPAIVETFRSNYHYLTNAAENFERADLIITVPKTFVTLPKVGAEVLDQTRTYRTLSYRDDDGSWFLHARPI